ncbi:hypothetical protein [Streptomyces sp. AC555_RSS877]|nr:hypothetical protein [Streptomyces sp. AC555_RSS877]
MKERQFPAGSDPTAEARDTTRLREAAPDILAFTRAEGPAGVR